MKTRTRAVITTCVAFLAVGIITSTAFSRAGGKYGKVEGFHLSAELMKQLDEEQIRKLKSLSFDLLKQVLPLKAELQVKQLELKQLWDADTLDGPDDENGILSKSDEAFTAEKQIRQATTRYYLEASKLLNKEQRTELMKSRHSKQNRHGKGRGFRGMRRDGDDDERKRMRHQSRDHHRMSREDIIEKFDEDGDGKISREERQNAADIRSSREHKKGDNRHHMSRKEIIEKFDEDGDGKISREERQNAAEWLSEEKDY